MQDVLKITPERRDELIGRLAAWIVRRRLEAPAVFAVEMNRPLTTLGATAFHFGSPVLGPLFGERFLTEVGLILEDRQNVDRLVARIESLCRERDSNHKSPSPAPP